MLELPWQGTKYGAFLTWCCRLRTFKASSLSLLIVLCCLLLASHSLWQYLHKCQGHQEDPGQTGHRDVGWPASQGHQWAEKNKLWICHHHPDDSHAGRAMAITASLGLQLLLLVLPQLPQRRQMRRRRNWRSWIMTWDLVYSVRILLHWK